MACVADESRKNLHNLIFLLTFLCAAIRAFTSYRVHVCVCVSFYFIDIMPSHLFFHKKKKEKFLFI